MTSYSNCKILASEERMKAGVKNFGIRNLKKFGIRNPYVWNPESICMESGIQPSESGIHDVESGIRDSLGFLYMGRISKVTNF